jgi:crossover junction endodeoxyribonuclease RusA
MSANLTTSWPALSGSILASRSVLFTAFGKPAQMGSKKGFVVNGRAVLVNTNDKAKKNWSSSVAAAAAQAMRGGQLFDGPVSVSVEFYFARPMSHFGSGKNASVLKSSAPEYHAQSPDLDKLLRAVNDAMTGIVYRDDRQICLIVGNRFWTQEQERAEIVVCELE